MFFRWEDYPRRRIVIPTAEVYCDSEGRHIRGLVCLCQYFDLSRPELFTRTTCQPGGVHHFFAAQLKRAALVQPCLTQLSAALEMASMAKTGQLLVADEASSCIMPYSGIDWIDGGFAVQLVSSDRPGASKQVRYRAVDVSLLLYRSVDNNEHLPLNTFETTDLELVHAIAAGIRFSQIGPLSDPPGT